MGSLVHRSVPTNLKWFPNCSPAHTLFQDRFKDVHVGSRWISTLNILSPNVHTKKVFAWCKWIKVGDCLTINWPLLGVQNTPRICWVPACWRFCTWFQVNSWPWPGSTLSWTPGPCAWEGGRNRKRMQKLLGHSVGSTGFDLSGLFTESFTDHIHVLFQHLFLLEHVWILFLLLSHHCKQNPTCEVEKGVCPWLTT